MYSILKLSIPIFITGDFMVCSFIGHRDCPNDIIPSLYKTIEFLIKEKNVDKFYVGTHGNFDFIAEKVLNEILKTYNFIEYKKVLAYMPIIKDENLDYNNTIFIEGLEVVHPKVAIIKRNRWMINNSDFLICYVNQKITNAYSFMKYAKNRGKTIINIADM